MVCINQTQHNYNNLQYFSSVLLVAFCFLQTMAQTAGIQYGFGTALMPSLQRSRTIYEGKFVDRSPNIAAVSAFVTFTFFY